MVLVVFCFVIAVPNVLAISGSDQAVTLNFFYGNRCPYCSKAEPFLDMLENKYPSLIVNRYEVYQNQDGQALLQKTALEHGVDMATLGVPIFFIGEDFLMGYGGETTTGNQLENLVKKYLKSGLSDIADSRYKTAISYLVEKKVVKGYSDGSFKPENSINRGEFLKILIEAKYPDQATGENCFSDVKDEWFAKYVCFSKARGIVKGYGDGSFRPASVINFAEALKMLTETFELTSNETGGQWYEQYANTAKANNFYLDGSEMSSLVKRGEMAEMVYRVQER